MKLNVLEWVKFTITYRSMQAGQKTPLGIFTLCLPQEKQHLHSRSRITVFTTTKMEAVAAMRDYLSLGGASDSEIDDFAEICQLFEDSGKEGRYEVYRLWARLLRHRRTPYRRTQVFDFADVLKDFIRVVVPGDIVDAPAPENAVLITAQNFVKFVVRYIDQAF